MSIFDKCLEDAITEENTQRAFGMIFGAKLTLRGDDRVAFDKDYPGHFMHGIQRIANATDWD